MKIVLTGSLGHIGLPLTKQLVSMGQDVTVITSKEERVASIEALGAKGIVGSIKDEQFMTDALTGADAAYLMITASQPGSESVTDVAQKQGEIYVNAIKKSGVRRVVNLSSVGANLGPESGALYIYNIIEGLLNELSNVSITHVRPTGMYYNYFAQIPSIRKNHAIYANYGDDTFLSLVAPEDIAPIVAEELLSDKTGKDFRYIASDESTPNEVAKTLGEAIGMPDLKWIEISDEDQLKGLINAGVPENFAKGLVQMQALFKTDVMYADYKEHHPNLGKVKLADFAKSFAKVYENNVNL